VVEEKIKDFDEFMAGLVDSLKELQEKWDEIEVQIEEDEDV